VFGSINFSIQNTQLDILAQSFVLLQLKVANAEVNIVILGKEDCLSCEINAAIEKFCVSIASADRDKKGHSSSSFMIIPMFSMATFTFHNYVSPSIFAEHHFSPEASLSSAETPRKSKGYDFSMVEAIFLSAFSRVEEALTSLLKRILEENRNNNNFYTCLRRLKNFNNKKRISVNKNTSTTTFFNERGSLYAYKLLFF
jgi:hypothetical protein